MKGWRSKQKPIACLVVLFLSAFCTVWSPARAALVSTGQIVNQTDNDAAREKVDQFMQRANVRQQLVDMGVDPDLARARVAAMTDAEIAQIADRIDQLPAGGDVLSSILIVIGIVALAFFITDLIGWTDIYQVVNKQR